MTRLPRSIKIGAHLYHIHRVGIKVLGRKAMGRCDYNSNRIHLLRGMTLAKSQEILLHEILHACCYPSLIDVQMDDELFVDNVAPHLLQVLQDNPKLVEYLTQKGKQ